MWKLKPSREIWIFNYTLKGKIDFLTDYFRCRKYLAPCLFQHNRVKNLGFLILVPFLGHFLDLFDLTDDHDHRFVPTRFCMTDEN